MIILLLITRTESSLYFFFPLMLLSPPIFSLFVSGFSSSNFSRGEYLHYNTNMLCSHFEDDHVLSIGCIRCIVSQHDHIARTWSNRYVWSLLSSEFSFSLSSNHFSGSILDWIFLLKCCHKDYDDWEILSTCEILVKVLVIGEDALVGVFLPHFRGMSCLVGSFAS